MLEKYLKDPKRFNIAILVILSILMLVTRLPFTSKYLFEWDSVDFALGFENYDIIHHQPQPPGYILYVGLGKIVNWIFHDANTTMVFLSIVFSIFTVVLVYFLAKQMFSEKIALVASLLLVFNPIFWFYGEVATIYPCEAFLATLIAYLSYNMLKGNDKYLYPAVIALGLAGGFREDLIIFMFPLWLFCLVYPDRSPKRIIKAFLVLIISTLIWFIPTILLAGGLDSFILANGHFGSSFATTSALFGASMTMQLLMDLSLFAWLILAFGIIGGLFVIIFALKDRKVILNNIKTPKLILLALWIFPLLIFQILIPLSKPGYILTYISAIALILAFIFNFFSISLAKKIKLSAKSILIILIAVYMVINSVYFIYPYNLHSEITWETSMNDMNQTQKITLGLDMLFMYNYEKIHVNDESMEQHLDMIKEISNSNNSIIVIRDILREDEGFSWRKAMYYLPDYSIYYLLDSENSEFKTSKETGNNIELLYGKNHSSNETSDNTIKTPVTNTVSIPTNSHTEQIIWIMSNQTEFFKEVESKNKLYTINLPDGLKIYYFDVQN